MNAKIFKSVMALVLVASFFLSVINVVEAAIAEVSTNQDGSVKINPATGFPSWYEDISGGGGDRLQLCLGVNEDGTGLADPRCVLVADATFNPALPISFPGNFPAEVFYYLADARILNAGPTGAARIDFRVSLEGSFAGGVPLAGDQTTFLRLNLKQFSNGDLTPNSTYNVTNPFGPAFSFTTDAQGSARASLGNQAFRAQDGGAAAGDFVSLLPAPATNISQFIQTVTAPDGYLGNPVVSQPLAGGGALTVTGPNIGGAGINTISTNLWNVAGKLSPSRISFITQPSANAIASLPLISQPQVAFMEGNGNNIVNTTGNVALAAFTDAVCATPAAAGSLLGNLTVPAVSGTASFTDLAFSINAVGTFFLKASNGDLTPACSSAINVAPRVASMNVRPINSVTTPGNAVQLTAVALDAAGVEVPGVVFTWTNDNLAAGSIDANGLFTALAAGRARIRALSGGVTSNQATINVQNPVVTTININPTAAAVIAGQTVQFSATALDQFGNPIIPQPTFVWTSGNATVATINTAGLATGVAAGGPVTIAAASGGVSGIASLTVTTAPVCQTTADTDANGSISNLEILNHVRNWKAGTVPNLEILNAIRFWKAGAGC